MVEGSSAVQPPLETRGWSQEDNVVVLVYLSVSAAPLAVLWIHTARASPDPDHGLWLSGKR